MDAKDRAGPVNPAARADFLFAKFFTTENDDH